MIKPSRLNTEVLPVTLPRPMGIVFEYDETRKEAVVVDLVCILA